jgi:hypothetical protein
MLDVWDFLAYVIMKVVDGLKAFKLLYGISLWNILVLTIALVDLGAILRAVFRDGSSGEPS